MQIKYLTKNGDLRTPNKARPSAHKDNIEFLKKNQEISEKIRGEVTKKIISFIEEIAKTGKGYMNSGQVASDVCNELGVPQDTFHHGLVGSALNLELENTDYDYNLIASKGEGQTWFDYFVSE